MSTEGNPESPANRSPNGIIASSRSADSPLGRAGRRFLRHRPALVGAVMVLFLLFVAVFAEVLAPYDPLGIDTGRRMFPPDRQNLLGTDQVGRDVLSRLIFGTRVSMAVGIVAVSIQLAIGFILGSLSGYLGGKADMVIMRFTDVVMTFPTFVLVLILVSIVGPTIYNVILVIGLFSWPGLARLVRGQVLSLREQEFILAARVVGVGDWGVLRKHLLPNVLGPISVAATLGVAEAVLTEAGLSFLGLGVRPPTPTWGTMIGDARFTYVLADMPWLWLVPGVAISFAVICINFIGDGLRDAFDVRGKNVLE